MFANMSLALALTVTLTAVGCAEPGDGATTDPTFIPSDTTNTGVDAGVDATGLPDTAPVGDGVNPPQDTVTPQPDGVTPQPDAVVTPDEGPTPLTGPVDPNCLDGQYTETLPNPNANISSILSSYSAGNEKQFTYDLLDARWPNGRWVLENGVAQGGVNGTSQDCFDFFRQSFQGGSDGLIGALSTLVHECGHGFDSANFGQFGAPSTYEVTPALTLACPQGGGTPPWGDGSTPPRSDILNDQWEQLKPTCTSCGQNGCFPDGCNSYGYIYMAQQGSAQGFNSVLEETLQYINSLGSDYAFQDQLNPLYSNSARDGILTFLWFVQRYLHLARTEYPSAYTLLTNSCWRDAILKVWGRAWLYIDATDGIQQLGIDDDQLMEFVLDPVLLNEIQLLRNAAGCN